MVTMYTYTTFKRVWCIDAVAITWYLSILHCLYLFVK